MYKRDQSGNVIESVFGAFGRKTHQVRDYDQVGVRRRGALDVEGLRRARRLQTVTQYDNSSVGTGTVLDQLKYTHEGWSQISKLEQDREPARIHGCL